MHLDLDSFFVSVERLQNREFVGIPLIIGGVSERGVVSSCSYEARQFGVHSAMPMRTALRLCPHARVIRGDMDSYTKHSNIVTQIIENRAPLVEKASIDEHYIDITGMDRFFGCLKWASELRATIIKESGLPISFGLSVNKTVAKIATGEAKPNGEKNVEKGLVNQFLDPLLIKRIPGVGGKTNEMLSSMGVRIIKDIRQLPVELLYNVFGDNGVSLWHKANGIDNSPVVPYRERKSISSERTFMQDTIDVAMLNRLLVKMVTELCFQLRKENKLCSTIAVKIMYANFDTHTQQAHIGYTACDHVLIEKVKTLFDKLYNRRMLIRLVGIKLSGLVYGSTQLDLFDDKTEYLNLYQAMDKVRLRYGTDKLMRASSIKSIIRKT